MKRYVEEGEETTDELGKDVGVLLLDGARGVILNFGTDNVGCDRYHLIMNEGHHGNQDTGNIDNDGSTIWDTLFKCKLPAGFTIYCFDSYKEMMTWFVKGMED
jgi:hypothetical protein